MVCFYIVYHEFNTKALFPIIVTPQYQDYFELCLLDNEPNCSIFLICL